MKFYGKSREVSEKVIGMFESGDVPEALSQIFVKRSDNIPSQHWSWRNRFIVAINGTADARGFNQWKEAGRKVSKGSHALHILGPCIAKTQVEDETGETITKSILYGFKSIPVFAIESTEIFDETKWQEASGVDQEEETRLSELPLRQVAAAWGLNVTSYTMTTQGYLGYYKHGSTIALGVENLATWAHELTHAADDKNGTMKKAHRQDPSNEIVAELGGAVLLKLMGYGKESDLGGAWDYIKAYAQNDKDKAIKRCFELIDRVCNAIDLIIKTSDQTQEEIAA